MSSSSDTYRMFECDNCGDLLKITDMRKNPYYHYKNGLYCGKYFFVDGRPKVPRDWGRGKKRRC